MSLHIGTDWREESRSIENAITITEEVVEDKHGNKRIRKNEKIDLQCSVFNDMCIEERWFNCFKRHIQPYQELEELTIVLISWRDINRYDDIEPWMMVSQRDEDTLNKWRNHLVRFLEDRIRGIDEVTVMNKHDDGAGLDRELRHWLAARMMRPKI